MGRMRNVTGLIGLAAVLVASASCGALVRQGRSPVYLVIDSLGGQRGGLGGAFGNPVVSDVVTKVTAPAPCSATSPCPTVFSDNGVATLRVELKDPTNLSGPSPTNDVTITRYHVSYRRSDGRNTEGIDVPFAFDGATTGTIRVGASSTLPFELVRIVAKEESPLANLVTSSSIVTSIAEVTFYGRDQAGNTLSVSGLLQVDFGNFGDF
jgi:hypothetical protein